MMRQLFAFVASLALVALLCLVLEVVYLLYDWCCWKAQERERRR